jgi:integrase
MAIKRNLEPVFDKIRNRWRVDVPASRAKDGRRYKAWFKTRDQARAHLEGINGSATPTAAIPPALAMKADEAAAILTPWSIDIVQAAREVAAALEILGDAGSILEAAKAFRANKDRSDASETITEAVKAFLLTKDDLRDSTLKSYKYTLEKTLEPIGKKTMAEVTTTDLEAILKGKGATARAMHRRTLRVFWKWASAAPRGWATMDAVDALEAPRPSNDNDIDILRPDAVAALLRAAESVSPAAAVSYAIAIFGGVRMAELSRLRWQDIGVDHIEIGKAVAKKHSRRLIPVCPSLKAWLKAHRGDAKDDDMIVGSNWPDVSKSVRRLAGWNVAARLLEDPPIPTRGSWPANACRHTCASVQVAIGTSVDDLTFKFGHSGGHDLLRAHYVSRLTKKDAIAILSVGPAGKKISNLKIA